MANQHYAIDASERGISLARMYWGRNNLPYNAKILGTVRRDSGSIGALLEFKETGIKVQGNAGCMTMLPILV